MIIYNKRSIFISFYIFCSFLLFCKNDINAQADSLNILFNPQFDNQNISILDIESTLDVSQNILIDKLIFYVSQIELYDNDELVFKEIDSYHLVDVFEEGSLNHVLKFSEKLSFTCIKFLIGVDSLTSVSGAMGGDLDPTNGMYWSWQSGYINFKLEGRSLDCPARKNKFQFHLGGYQEPFYALQEVVLDSRKITDTSKIRIKIDLDQLLSNINLKETYQIMSPNEQSMKIAKLLPSIFSISE